MTMAKTMAAVAGAAKAAPSPTPSTYAVILDAIERNVLTVAELDGIRRACQKQVKFARNTGMILTEVSVNKGDRVRINGNYFYKTMQGITGTVREVEAYKGGRNPWVVVRMEPDALPTRRPKYAVAPDGLVHVAGHCIDLIAS